MSDDNDRDCAICLQKCHHPTQLPCGHIFCFLCVKGVAIQSKKCAMCRAPIPPNYLENPVLLEQVKTNEEYVEEPQTEYQWYYEGRNGWWKYEERSNIELEEAFKNGSPDCRLLLAGTLYRIDFQTMTQLRCNDPTKRRRVKRDTSFFPAKGVAGIKLPKSQPREEAKSQDNINVNIVNQSNYETIEISDYSSDVEIVEIA